MSRTSERDQGHTCLAGGICDFRLFLVLISKTVLKIRLVCLLTLSLCLESYTYLLVSLAFMFCTAETQIRSVEEALAVLAASKHSKKGKKDKKHKKEKKEKKEKHAKHKHKHKS